MAGDRSGEGSRRRGWAVLALVMLGLLGLGCLVTLVAAVGDLALLGLAAAVNCAVLAAAGWWAFTTRRTWKRRLNLALAGLAALLLAVDLVWFGLRRGLWLVGLLLLVTGYVATGRRAVRRPVRAAGGPAPERPWLLVNPRSGDGKAVRLDLAAVARRRGVAVRLLEPGEDPAELARAAVAAGADMIGMAGGDGSLALVAAVAAEAGVPFVCVPAGTRNHFAHDLGLDRGAPLRALDAYDPEAGQERRVDLAAVGDRVFVNNVSLGAYADMVHEPGYREAKLATAHMVLPDGLRGTTVPRPLTVRDPAGEVHTGPLLLLVANNPYELRPPLRLGDRSRLDTGTLQVSVLFRASGQGAALARIATQLAVGRTPAESGWTQWTVGAVRVDVPDTTVVPAGVDGEAVQLPVPLLFRSLPGALRVRVPSASTVRSDARLLSPTTVRALWTLARGGTR
ncbi:MAG: diacylglycerol/lipid kinase family protein [Mycobacteriales bacterium]